MNMRVGFKLVALVALLLGLCGCMSYSVQHMGKHTLYWENPTSAAIADDGSFILAGFRCFGSDAKAPKPSGPGFYDIRFKPETIRRVAKRVEALIASDPGAKEHPVWDDGVVLVELSWTGEVTPANAKPWQRPATTAPVSRGAGQPVQLLPIGIRELQQQGANWGKVGYNRYMARYIHGDTNCWLLVGERYSQDYEDPGSGLTRGLLVVPAVIGDIVTVPIQFITLLSAAP